ncbi:hypothetical protein AU074_13895 [Pseudomonas sp. ATCC PTA-122608]|nr:hypothetical protein AU074_13895 [Pseudomonas sp. ATCC PTA-122608]
MSDKIKSVNEFWAKVCQLFDETEIGVKRLFIFQENYDCEEVWHIDSREISEDEGVRFTTKLQFCSVKHGCTSWVLDLSEIVDVDCESLIMTIADDGRYKFRVEDEDYDFGHEYMNKDYFPF